MKYLLLLALLVGCENPIQLEGRCFSNFLDDTDYKVIVCNTTYCRVKELGYDRVTIEHRSIIQDQLQFTCPKE
jgi:hypothetical protein